MVRNVSKKRAWQERGGEKIEKGGWNPQRKEVKSAFKIGLVIVSM